MSEVVAVPAGAPGPPTGDRLLHLDLHPFNILVDERDEVSGVIDWANASAGHPDLDRARSASIFRWDPAAAARKTASTWTALIEGWEESAELGGVPSGAMAWACQYMLEDLGPRYQGDELTPVRRALKALSNRS